LRLRVQRPCGSRGAQGGERLGVAFLTDQRHPEIELRVRIIPPALEDEAKRTLGVGERVTLQVLPSLGEGHVDVRSLILRGHGVHASRSRFAAKG
jgi:hypothetical protein